MVCDDSVVIRRAITRMLERDPGIEVVACVANGHAAVEELGRQAVEIVVLDIEMPVMDGMAALPLLLRADPDLRVIMASTLTTRGADIAMKALRLGASDYIPKPDAAAIADESFARDLIAKVHGLARLRRRAAGRPRVAAPEAGGNSVIAPRMDRPPSTSPRLVQLRPAPAHPPRPACHRQFHRRPRRHCSPWWRPWARISRCRWC